MQSECLPDDLKNEVENAQVDDHRAGPEEVVPIFNGKTEELMKAVPTPHNIRLAWRKFLQLISKGVDIQYGKKLEKLLSDGKLVTATFED